MKVIKGYKTELDPNNMQRSALIKHCGAARWAFNWGLFRKQQIYADTGKSISAIDLHRELNYWKKSDLAWMYAVSKSRNASCGADLETAFKNFFDGRNGKRQGDKVGYPRPKSKKKGLGSFRLYCLGA